MKLHIGIKKDPHFDWCHVIKKLPKVKTNDFRKTLVFNEELCPAKVTNLSGICE